MKIDRDKILVGVAKILHDKIAVSVVKIASPKPFMTNFGLKLVELVSMLSWLKIFETSCFVDYYEIEIHIRCKTFVVNTKLACHSYPQLTFIFVTRVDCRPLPLAQLG